MEKAKKTKIEKLAPVGKYVMLELIEQDEMSPGGIIIPDTDIAVDAIKRYIVRDPGVWKKKLTVGQVVTTLFPTNRIDSNGRKYYFVRFVEILSYAD